MTAPDAPPRRPRGRRGRRTWPQRLFLALNTLLVLACLALAGGFQFMKMKAESVPTLDLGGVTSADTKLGTDQPRNILLIASDSAAGLDEDDPVTEGRDNSSVRADVIMIVRIDPADDTIAMLSIPRDTWVPVAPNWTKTKINAAIAGPRGAEDLISTIKHDFAISINNFVQVDFKGFTSIVDTLGGIPVYLEHPVRDRATGLNLLTTGCITLESFQALAYARSRHLTYQAGSTYQPRGRWIADGTSDLGRITRQQDFVRKALARAVSEGLRNPSTASGLISEALGSVKVDQGMTLGGILELVRAFRTYDVSNVQRFQLPTESAGDSSLSYQTVLAEQAEPILDLFRGFSYKRPVRPDDVIVDVVAPSSTASAASTALERVGFDADVGTGTLVESSGRRRSRRRAGTTTTVERSTSTTVERSDSTTVEDTAATTGSTSRTGRDPGGPDTTGIGAAGSRTDSGSATIHFGFRGIDAALLLASYLDGQATFVFDRHLPGRRLVVELPEASIVRSTARAQADTEQLTAAIVAAAQRNGVPLPPPVAASIPGVTTVPATTTTITPTTLVGVLPVREGVDECN
ncbi:MAG: LCP family protein [Microthrixaceae bacterium]